MYIKHETIHLYSGVNLEKIPELRQYLLCHMAKFEFLGCTVMQGFHLAFFQKLKRKIIETQAHFGKNSSNFFSKTQQNLQNSTFRKIFTKF